MVISSLKFYKGGMAAWNDFVALPKVWGSVRLLLLMSSTIIFSALERVATPIDNTNHASSSSCLLDFSMICKDLVLDFTGSNEDMLQFFL